MSRVPGLVVVARLQAAAGREDDLIAEAAKMASASRAEEGCVNYRFYADTEQPGHFAFVEEWVDDAALKHHFTQPHTAEFMGAIRGLVERGTDALFHTVSSTRKLGRSGLEPVE